MPAILEAWRAGLFRRDRITSDLAAGAVVGVVALPLAMAFAIASGAKPEQGLYTALLAGLLVTLLGGSRVQIAGPTGAFAVLLVTITAKFGFAGLQIITLMAGLILVVLGLSRLGAVIRYMPESVVLGFTAGIAVVIWVGQWQNFFGLPAVEGTSLLEKLPGLVRALPQLDLATTLIGVASLAVLVLWPKIPVLGKVPAPMVALLAGTAAVAVWQPASVATIGSVFGGIPSGLPHFTPPHLSMAQVPELVQPAIAIALLGAIESLLSATVADGLIGTKHDPNQELVGQGIANVGASLFGGFAATGAIARTATSVRHGGRSPIAGLSHAATIALVLLVLAPLANNVPLTTLAAILFVVAWDMSQLARVARIARRAPRSDVGVMFATMALAIFADLSIAVEVGVILALLNFLRRMIATVEVRALPAEEFASHIAEDPGYRPGSGISADAAELRLPEGIIVYTVDGPFFFGAAEQFESALLHSDSDPHAVIIKLARVPFIDLTGLVALRDVVGALRKRGVRVYLCDALPAVEERLRGDDLLGEDGAPASLTLGAAVMLAEEADSSGS